MMDIPDSFVPSIRVGHDSPLGQQVHELVRLKTGWEFDPKGVEHSASGIRLEPSGGIVTILFRGEKIGTSIDLMGAIHDLVQHSITVYTDAAVALRLCLPDDPTLDSNAIPTVQARVSATNGTAAANVAPAGALLARLRNQSGLKKMGP